MLMRFVILVSLYSWFMAFSVSWLFDTGGAVSSGDGCLVGFSIINPPMGAGIRSSLSVSMNSGGMLMIGRLLKSENDFIFERKDVE